MDSDNDYRDHLGLGIHITTALAFRLLVGIVERFGPNHRASDGNDTKGCRYIQKLGARLTPVCIVGQLFSDLGILALLTTGVYDENDSSVCQYGGIWQNGPLMERLAYFGVALDEDAAEFLSVAQSQQDGGKTWAESLEFAANVALDKGWLNAGPDPRPAVERVDLNIW